MNRVFFTLLAVFCCAFTAFAHPKIHFNPEEFKEKQHEFLINAAQLTPEEQKAFFPLFDECKEKERALFECQRKTNHKPNTDDDYVREINSYDKIGLKLKKLQQTYHEKYLKVLSPEKVWKIIKAEDKFRQKVIKNMSSKCRQH